jgi:adenylyl-sulfate kinase
MMQDGNALLNQQTARDQARPLRDGYVIWLTGMSGAGKSTLAQHLADILRSREERVEVLDGDVVREHLSQGLGFSRADRDTNIARIAFVAQLLARNGVNVLVAAISPYRAARQAARTQIGRFLEVYVECPLDELVRRDVKGLYARALARKLQHFTGVSDPYEAPLDPDVLVRTDQESIEQSAARILAAISQRGWLPEVAPDGTRA